MNQGNTWEREYKSNKLVTGKDEPQKDTLRFLKFLKKEEKYKVEGKNILDLGSGTGRNANYLAGEGNNVIGIEISSTALNIAKERAKASGVNVDYRLGDIGSEYGIDDELIDVILDVTSSNSLDEKGREIYLSECSRVLKSGGYMFVRALCKDGNKNVKNLLIKNPGGEKDTYIMPELGLTERVFSREDLISTYSKYFKILHLEKKTNYPTVSGRVYKRDYWIMYLQK